MNRFSELPASPLPSPCIKQCQLNSQQVCQGCQRTLDEIAGWSQFDESRKQQIWLRLLSLREAP